MVLIDIEFNELLEKQDKAAVVSRIPCVGEYVCFYDEGTFQVVDVVLICDPAQGQPAARVRVKQA